MCIALSLCIYIYIYIYINQLVVLDFSETSQLSIAKIKYPFEIPLLYLMVWENVHLQI
jgi:hypothetical protein